MEDGAQAGDKQTDVNLSLSSDLLYCEMLDGMYVCVCAPYPSFAATTSRAGVQKILLQCCTAMHTLYLPARHGSCTSLLPGLSPSVLLLFDRLMRQGQCLVVGAGGPTEGTVREEVAVDERLQGGWRVHGWSSVW